MSDGGHAAEDAPGARARRANLSLGVLLPCCVIAIGPDLGGEGRFARLLTEAEPAWLLVGIAAQLGAYLCSSTIGYRIAWPRSRVRPSTIPGLELECSVWQLGIVWLLDAATLGAMLRAVGEHPSIAAVLSAEVLAAAVASLGIVPAGLGLCEATSIATLRLLDVPLEATLAATLLARGWTFWLPPIPGLALARRETRRNADHEHLTHASHDGRAPFARSSS
jgi:uncharacterized membrane protein YbhN (UPF0104 family)